MKVFHCDCCDQLVFFENSACVSCGHVLAFLPDAEDMATLEPTKDDRFRAVGKTGGEREYRLCKNYREQNVCNWAVPADDPNPFCLSCQLTRVIPDLSRPGVPERWAKLEMAKRRLIYSLLNLDLPLPTKIEDADRGLTFEFLVDPEGPGAAPVLTGHAGGVITINVAEADDAERERRRNSLKEDYRTLLGHFRHEVGHYYWDRLIQEGDRLDAYRALFGDERADYGEALARYHQDGPSANWRESFVSAYATAHPWEDWAETWAHYLHMIDTLETAFECGLSLRPKRSDEPTLKPNVTVVGPRSATFDQLIERWFPLTYVLNNLNRGMGLQDGYPFVLSIPAQEKLRFVHDVAVASATPDAPGRPTRAQQRGLFQRIGAMCLFGL
ncbi:MAG: putative zinc-binding peptidase [Isosphaeraceae bacterium]|nr:putative zinc-binding peptidase [Isosphaeraceae bacterium]